MEQLVALYGVEGVELELHVEAEVAQFGLHSLALLVEKHSRFTSRHAGS